NCSHRKSNSIPMETARFCSTGWIPSPSIGPYRVGECTRLKFLSGIAQDAENHSFRQQENTTAHGETRLRYKNVRAVNTKNSKATRELSTLGWIQASLHYTLQVIRRIINSSSMLTPRQFGHKGKIL